MYLVGLHIYYDDTRSLPCLQLIQFTTHNTFSFKIYFSIIYASVYITFSVLQVSQIKICAHFLSTPSVQHDTPILSYLTCSYDAHNVWVALRSLRLPWVSQNPVFSSASCRGFSWCDSRPPPLVGQGILIIEASLSHLRHTTVGRTPLDEWSARPRDLYLTTHSTHKTSMAPGGIRTRNLSRRAAADPHLRPRVRRNRAFSVCAGQLLIFARNPKLSSVEDMFGSVMWLRLLPKNIPRDLN